MNLPFMFEKEGNNETYYKAFKMMMLNYILFKLFYILLHIQKLEILVEVLYCFVQPFTILFFAVITYSSSIWCKRN